MLSVRLVLHCLLLIIFCQHVEVEVDQLHSSDSPLPVEDSILTEARKSQIELNRQKRNVCQLVNNEIQCTCFSEFTWNATFCRTYHSCSANTTADQTCTCIRAYPVERQFCDPTVTTPTQSTSTSTSTSSSTSTSTSTSTSMSTSTSSSTSTSTSTSTSSSTSTSTSTSTLSSTSTSGTTTSKSTTSPPGQENRTFAVTIENLIFSNELKNPSSAVYENRSKEFTTLLNEAYRRVVPNASVKVLGFANGSIIVLHQVFSSSPLTDEEVASSRTAVNNTLSGVNYISKFIPDDEIPCTDSVFGTTKFNFTAKIPCMEMEGDRRRRCGKNGKYNDEHNFCVLPAIRDLLQVTNSTAEVAKNFSNLLHELSTVSIKQNITNPGNVEAVVTILTTFSEVNNTVTEIDMENFLQTVNSVISNESIATWEVLSSTTAETSISSQLLQSVETFSSRLNLTNGTLDIDKDNLQLRATKIDSREAKSPINVTFKNFATERYVNLSTNIIIPTDELEELVDNVVVTIAYPTWIDILPSKANFEGNFSINGLVVTITLSDKRPINIKMNFSTRNPTLDFNSAQCAFWDFTGNGIWNNAGCTPDLDGENVICNCKHITSFSILMSAKTAKSPILRSITQIGVAVSLASLIITIIIEAVVWRHVTKSEASHIRHVAILNIAINLLIADVWFIVAASVKQNTGACVAATFFIHVFYLALFFWMFTLGLLLVYHLVFLFHDFSKSVLMGISFGIGYLCPIIISVITIGVTYPQNSYIRKDACWLSWREKYPILAFIIPALSIIASNFIVLVVVIFKLLRPTIGDRPRRHNEEKDTIKPIVRSIAVLTPILGLTWAFGIPTFQENSHDAFDYIFTILNAFQGFFILVFGTCMDKKVREALLKKFSLTGFSSRSRTVQSTSTGRFTSKHGIALPGRSKKLDISGRSYSDSKEKYLSYSTLS
ncbi:adhesion G protein-coupled receptor F4-like isoform X2 [Mobula hypostoma]|uniref:adhesion G protein-coupled receptor F4-like isoform X2 n=1 Tax=Mobula hypostoma TaxID=723540 RepID=UPI002FC28BA0